MRWNKGGNGDGEGSYEKPPTGYAIGILAAIYDLGVRETPGSRFGPKHQVCLWWELNHRDSEGAPIGLRDVVTMSTMQGSHLNSRIEAINGGRVLTDAQRDDFDPRSILGGRAKLLLHANEGGNPFVKMAMPLEGNEADQTVYRDYGEHMPAFVAKIVGDEMKDTMLADIRNGGAAGHALGIRGTGDGVQPGAAPAGASTSQTAASAAPPPAPTSGTTPALPAGWAAHKAPDGRTYYQRPDGSTTWDAPGSAAEEVRPPSPPPADSGEDVPF